MKEALHSAGSFRFQWKNEGAAREVASATCVLTLGIVGNAILPIPFAFSITGAIAGVLIFVGTALANRLTCRLLLRGAVASATCDYEGLAEAIGGPAVRWAVEVSTVLLLLGTNIGGIIQVGGSAAAAIEAQWPGQATWLVDNHGFYPMLICTLAIMFPLSLLPSMRKLEVVGAVGSLIVWVLAIVILVKSCSNGLPQLGSTFPVVGFTSLGSVAQAFSLAGFAFYLQAMLMPLLGELSPGVAGAAAASKAVDITIMCSALTTYLVAGFFGAAMYGDQTNSNALVNEWLPGVGTVILNLLVTAYLILSIPPIVFANVHTVQHWVNLASRGRTRNYPAWIRRLISTTLVLGVCLAVALAVPGESGTVLTFTGATFVCAVSYIFPVTFHWVAYYGRARYQAQKAEAEADLAALAGSTLLVAAGSLAAADTAGKMPAVETAGKDGSEQRGGQQSSVCLDSSVAGGAIAAPQAAPAPLPMLPSPFEAVVQLAPNLPAEDEPQLPGIPEGGSVDLPAGSGFLQSLSGIDPSRSHSTKHLLLDLLHASLTAAPQRSQELEDALSQRGSGMSRQALFRQSLMGTSMMTQAMTAGLSRTLTIQQLDTDKGEDLVLALLPPYRRSRQRHQALEALVEMVLPAIVLAMGLFFSVSTLVMLFQ